MINGAGLVEAIDIAVLTGHLQDEALRSIYDADGQLALELRMLVIAACQSRKVGCVDVPSPF